MRYFVTGATGFIGGRVARMLVQEGHQVVAIARDPARAAGLLEAGIDVRPGDVTDRESMRPAMTGVDGVFHIAGWYKIGMRDKSEGEKINVQGTRNVLELMRELGVPRGVYTSTLAVFSDTHGRLVDESYYYEGPHLSEYDRTKWVAHYQVAEPMMKAGLPLVIVLPGLVYGPGDTSSVRVTFMQYLQRKLPLLPDRTAFCWAHIDDIARGHLLAMEKGQTGESYIIAGPMHTLVDAILMAEQITGVPAPRLRLSPALMRAMAGFMGLVDRVISVPETYTGEGLRITAGVTYIATNARARRELGYAPRPLQAGLGENLQREMELLGMKIRK